MITTLYVIVTMILFSLNFFANIAVLATTQKDKFPFSAFFATILSVLFVIWGIVVLVS
jgi:hypothetical protein